MAWYGMAREDVGMYNIPPARSVIKHTLIIDVPRWTIYFTTRQRLRSPSLGRLEGLYIYVPISLQ